MSDDEPRRELTRVDPIKDDPAEVLKQIGRELLAVDRMVIGLMARRAQLSEQVVFAKHRQSDSDHPLGAPIFRQGIELKRLEGIREVAREYGLNPEFAAALLYVIIGESCKLQMSIAQEGHYPYGEVSYPQLKQHLQELADLAAADYDDNYARSYPATQDYLNFESDVLDRLATDLGSRPAALDLGCSTGRISLRLADRFERVHGVDLSPKMVDRAQQRAEEAGVTNASFVVGDIEQASFWETFGDASIDLVTMGLGTAGDVLEIGEVLDQIERVLVPGGRFLLSFYNADALLYQWSLMPWPASLAAVIDLDRHCLDVHLQDRGVYSVYARAYSTDELSELFGRGRLHLSKTHTHPTYSSILPREMLLDSDMSAAIRKLDLEVASQGGEQGAYTLVVGRKR